MKIAKRLTSIDSILRLLEAATPEGKEWDIVVVRAGLSKNGKYYLPEALREAAPLFEGAKVAAYQFAGDIKDHVPPEVMEAVPVGFAKNIVGWIENVRWVESDNEIRARLHISDNAVWLRQLLRDSFAAGKKDLLGFSIDAFGDWVKDSIDGQQVDKVLKLNSVNELTVVTWPAAGGRALRLVAGMPAPPAEDAKMKRLIAALLTFGESWTKGYKLTESDAATEVPRFLAEHRDRLLKELTAASDGKIREAHAEAVSKLMRLIELIKDDKKDEAVSLAQEIEKMIAKGNGGYPAPAREGAAVHPAAAADAGEAAKVLREAQDLRRQLEADLASARVVNALAGSSLPEKAQERVRRILEGKNPTSEQIQEAITAEREYLASIAAPTVTGGGAKSVSVGDDERAKYAKGMYAMLTGAAEEDKIPAFESLHESFRIVTGYGGPRAEVGRRLMVQMAAALPGTPGGAELFKQHHKALRESSSIRSGYLREALQTTTWAEVFGDSIRRALQKEYALPPLNGWRKVVSDIVPLQDFRTNRRIRVGGFTDLSTVGELGTYTEKAEPADQEETYAAQKRGNLFAISWETLVNDDLGRVRRIPRDLGRAAARTLDKFVLNTNLTSNPTVGSDAIALVNASHANNQTAALSEASLQTAIEQMLKQTELSSAERVSIVPKILVVPPDLQNTAWELIESPVKVTANEDSTVPSVIRNRWGLELLINVWQLDTNDWFLVADPRLYPTIEVGFLGGRQEPEIFVQDGENLGSVLTADKITYKIRHVYGAAVLDFRSFAGSIVA